MRINYSPSIENVVFNNYFHDIPVRISSWFFTLIFSNKYNQIHLKKKTESLI